MNCKAKILLSTVLAVLLSTAGLARQQPQPGAEAVSQQRALLIAMAAQREAALLFKAYWFTVSQGHYTRLEVYCTGMAYTHQLSFFGYDEFSAGVREQPKLLGVAQLEQIKGLIKTLTLGTSEPARSYRAAQKVVAVTFRDDRGYKQREYHSIYELPPGIRGIAAVVDAAKPSQSTSSETKRLVWAMPDGDVCNEPAEEFDAETASREELTRQTAKRHLYPRQRRDLMKIYLRRFYNEKDEIDRYIKKYVEATADQR